MVRGSIGARGEFEGLLSPNDLGRLDSIVVKCGVSAAVRMLLGVARGVLVFRYTTVGGCVLLHKGCRECLFSGGCGRYGRVLKRVRGAIKFSV